jgi:hypothetical protein
MVGPHCYYHTFNSLFEYCQGIGRLRPGIRLFGGSIPGDLLIDRFFGLVDLDSVQNGNGCDFQGEDKYGKGFSFLHGLNWIYGFL